MVISRNKINIKRLPKVVLETKEDQFWNKVAEKRDKKGSRFITHTNEVYSAVEKRIGS